MNQLNQGQQPQRMLDSDRSRRNRRLWVGGLLLLSLALVFALTQLLASGGSRQAGAAPGGGVAHLPDGSSGAASSSSTATPTSSTDTNGGSASPTTNPALPAGTPVPFVVTNVTVTTPQDYVGPCSSTTSLTFTATITVPAGTAGGTVSYRWVRSTGIESEDRMVTFAPGQTTQTVSDTWGIGYGEEQPYSDFIQVFAPNYYGNVFSSQVHVTCQGMVTSITASFSPTSYLCFSPSVKVTFTAVFTVTPGPATTISYQIYIGLNGNFGRPYTGSVPVPANATAVTVTKTYMVTRLSPSGTYYSYATATSMDSNIATFTKSC